MAATTAGTTDSSSNKAQPAGYGSIISLRKSGFGFIRPVGGSLDLFFHFSQLNSNLDASQLTVGQPVCYTLGTDPKTGRPCACDVRPASSDEVQHELLSDEQFLGRVIQWPPGLQNPALAAGVLRSEAGLLRYIDVTGHVAHLTFTAVDVQLPRGLADSGVSRPTTQQQTDAAQLLCVPAASTVSQPAAQQTSPVSTETVTPDGTQSVAEPPWQPADPAGARQSACVPAEFLQQADTHWVLFRLCQRNIGVPDASVLNQVTSSGVTRHGAREGFRAVEVQPVQHVDSLAPGYKPQLTLLDVLADLHPR